MAQTDIAKLAEEFVDAILKQREAIESGTTKDVRRYARKIMPCAKRLVRMGDEGIRQFATLLVHPNRKVRGTAGVYLFSSMPQEVLAMFKELAQGDDLTAIGARLRIKQWEEHPEQYDESNWA